MSLPLLIKRLNVPEAVFGETTSHLMLSLVPLVSVLLVPVPPSESCSAPSAKVSNVNAVPVPVVATPPDNVRTSLNVVPEPVSTVIEFPAVPAAEDVNSIAVVASVASTPILAASTLDTKLSI